MGDLTCVTLNKTITVEDNWKSKQKRGYGLFNSLNAELNPISHLLALLAHHIFQVSRVRVKGSSTHHHNTPNSETRYVKTVGSVVQMLKETTGKQVTTLVAFLIIPVLCKLLNIYGNLVTKSQFLQNPRQEVYLTGGGFCYASA